MGYALAFVWSMGAVAVISTLATERAQESGKTPHDELAGHWPGYLVLAVLWPGLTALAIVKSFVSP